MPADKVFVDTNTLLYIHDRRSVEKGGRALTWLQFLTDRQLACVNLQVLNELTHVLLRKKWFDAPEEAFLIADEFTKLGNSAMGKEDVRRARGLHLRFGYSWWDCLLLTSALELGCNFFLSEDLQDGQAIEGLTIVDPFAHSPDQIFSSR